MGLVTGLSSEFVIVIFQQSVEGMSRCCNLYCVLSAGFFSCYFSPEEIDAKVQPCLRVPVTKVSEGGKNVIPSKAE